MEPTTLFSRSDAPLTAEVGGKIVMLDPATSSMDPALMPTAVAAGESQAATPTPTDCGHFWRVKGFVAGERCRSPDMGKRRA